MRAPFAYLDRPGGLLSGGQQRLAIARALVAKPSIPLMDEPTEGIRPDIVEEIVLRDDREEGLTIVPVGKTIGRRSHSPPSRRMSHRSLRHDPSNRITMTIPKEQTHVAR